ncbi:MAG: hypothetical protein CME68_06005 [Halobacteriovoraceae bacterium]|nr:hypothetical protein [Halobacteriovoraceae bacterium]
MEENKTKILLITIFCLTSFIGFFFYWIFWATDERGSVEEILAGERFIHDPYQSLKNKEIRELNTMWKGFEGRTGFRVGLFVLRKKRRYDKVVGSLSTPAPKQIFVIGASKEDLIDFKLGKQVKCPKEALKEHLESRILHLLKLQAPDVASFELRNFIEKNCKTLKL